MASGRTVRQVKHGERLRRSQTSLAPALTSPCPDDLLKLNNNNRDENKTNVDVEVEGYGPYKPAPPPKPHPQQAPGRVTPPPYRMPPYPLYNEPNIPMAIPGAAGLDVPIATSSPANTQNLQTHSSKFPIEREVILSSSDKNSKIPLLNDYIKRTKGTIAPDIPPKQISAWTQGQQILSPDQNHSGHTHSGQPNDSLYRATYHNPQEYYNGPNPGTGAVPRSTWECEIPSRLHAASSTSDEYANNAVQTVSVQIENTKETNKEPKNKTMTKTYHTIKDIISSKFKSNKDNDEKTGDEMGLNNMADEIRKSTRNIDKNVEENGECVKRKPAGEQGIYGKPRTDGGITMQQHQYNQHVMQQHMLAQQAIQQFQTNQPFKNQQQMYQLTQSRSQEMISARHEEYYPNSYIPTTPQRPQRNNTQLLQSREPYLVMPLSIETQHNKDTQLMEDRRLTDLRSPQQIERDSLRQQSFEARRTASQPQLAYETEIKNDIPDNKPQPQIPQLGNRRGSHGNYVEATKLHDDSDEGGFIKKNLQKDESTARNEGTQDEILSGKDESKVSSGLIGQPRKRLEGEIGKIEGVYNVGQRERNPRKHNAGSAASSDYEKPSGGQSSSAADSGRGSAAYSSGRTTGRHGPADTPNHDLDSVKIHNGNYRDLSTPQGHDPEWVDIVETELRHILEPQLDELSLQGNGNNVANSTLSESISSMSPPLPPLSPDDQSSHNMTPQPHSNRYKHNNIGYGGSKQDYSSYSKSGSMSSRWYGNSSSHKHRSQKKHDHTAILRSKQIFGLDMTDITSTTTRSLDLESMLDGQSVSDGDISTTDARTIRKQLEGLENMYTDVLKLLGVKNYFGRYQPSDPRINKRRYGSISSLPSSSVSSRPIRDKRRAHEDRKKVRDIRGINKRFQRLESHVVTLARSVAHLSSEMRTQHIMIQEMENIRGEIAALRTQTNMLNVRSQSTARVRPNMGNDLPNLANPTRVKKLTKFFGDEPPLLRLFLRKLGYEKYASLFENERIGMVELPYLSEERLQKMGVPLGPRLRIMEEAQISVCKDTTLCIV